MNEKLSGILKLFNEECQFSYENGILNISFDLDNEEIKPLTTGKINQDTITGLINDELQFVTFFVGNSDYHTGLSVKFLAKTTFSIAVKFYIIHAMPLENLHFNAVKLRFINDKLRKFLNYYETHDLPKKITKKPTLRYSTTFNTSVLKKEVKVHKDGINITIYPYFSLLHSYSNIRLHSGLDVVYKSKSINFNFLHSLYVDLYNLLKFLFYRQNVELGSISIFLKHKVGNKFLFEEFGKCFMPLYNRYEMEDSDLNKNDDFGFVTWDIISDHLPSLFELVSKDELYLYNIPLNKKEKRYTSINSISLDASAFEFEFNNIYGSINLFSDLTDRTIIKNKFKELLKTLDNDNQRNIVTNCIQVINNPTLRMKNKKALEDFAFVIEPLTQKLGYANYIEDISKEFVAKRNAIDHGLKNLSIDSNTASTFFIERILVYSMQLRRIGMGDEDILKTVKLVFELFNYF